MNSLLDSANSSSTPRASMTGAAMPIDMSKFPKLDNDILVSKEEMQYSVTNPQDGGGYIIYECCGVDRKGRWEGKRRYSEFFLLRTALCTRWPAIPIPFLPEKKIFGNKELNFL
jgi:hypothetical protein